MFFATFHSFSERSGAGPLGPVRKFLLVQSGPEGPQFPMSIGTIDLKNKGLVDYFWLLSNRDALFQNHYL